MTRITTACILSAALTFGIGSTASAQERPKIGLAFGGGSARGIAHVGVIRWFEEHQIPIDLAAGTSMGGLIGGSFATGMSAAELEQMLSEMNWDELFGSSNFAFKSVRRKADARAYPSRLEFGAKGGIRAPTSLNSGEQVDLLLARITAPYYGIATFDELPTPFRAVAVDLLMATQVVMDRGSLASAMRATMSLPMVFPPVELDGRVLVDGGAMNNVPADVARRMGAGVVIAVNVGDLSDRTTVDQTLLGLAGGTVDAMMRANTKASLPSADVVLNVPLKEYGSLDWRRSKSLIEEGYKAAEAMRDRLLPHAVDDAEWRQWLERRRAARRTNVPAPAFVTLQGVSKADEQRMTVLLARHVGRPLDIVALQRDLTQLSGLDRYETLGWRLESNPAGDVGLLVRGRAKPYAPPFLMLGLNLENTTSDSFGVSVTARYLAFDLPLPGAEFRIDGTLGSNPGIGMQWYQPLGSSPLFVSPYAGIGTRTYNVIQEDAVVARYGQTLTQAGVDLGVNLGAISDVRLGAYIGRLDANAEIGDPGLPSVSGKESVARLVWKYDGQDSPVIPSRGVFTTTQVTYTFDGPTFTPPLETQRSSLYLTQFESSGSVFWSPGHKNRVFVTGGLGTSFDGNPLPTDQFLLGQAFRLGAYNRGEVRGDHYCLATGGYLRELGRLPDFLGGSIFAGGWVENGDAFDDWNQATLRTQVGGGLIMESLVGPVFAGVTAGFDGRWRTYLGIGRIFR